MTDSIRGAAKGREGAGDVTILIWKVIHASPGITKDEILAKIEPQIPEGWARRRYANVVSHGIPNPADVDLAKARRFILSHQLSRMAENGSIARDRDLGGYTTRREIGRYRGNPETIDETGRRAADHLNAAYALPTAESAIARVNPRLPRPTAAEWQAIVKVVKNARHSPANGSVVPEV